MERFKYCATGYLPMSQRLIDSAAYTVAAHSVLATGMYVVGRLVHEGLERIGIVLIK